MTTDDVMSCDPAVPPTDATGLPDWIAAPDPTDPFAYREPPAWATEPTSLHRPCPAPDDPPRSEPGTLRGMEQFREAVAKLRAAGEVFARETPTGWGPADVGAAYAAAAADHAAGLPLPAVQPPDRSAAVLPSPAPAVQPPDPAAAPRASVGLTREERRLHAELMAVRPAWSPQTLADVLACPTIRARPDRALVRLAFLDAADDPSTFTPRRLLHEGCASWTRAETTRAAADGLIGRHRSGEPPSRRGRARGVAAVLPWNWFRR